MQAAAVKEAALARERATNNKTTAKFNYKNKELEDRVQQQQRLEDRLQQQQQRLDVLENALAKMSERMECSICHEIMHEPTTLVPCLHSFCSACVKKRRNPLCPVCRGRVENESCNVHLADIIEHFLEAHLVHGSVTQVKFEDNMLKRHSSCLPLCAAALELSSSLRRLNLSLKRLRPAMWSWH